MSTDEGEGAPWDAGIESRYGAALLDRHLKDLKFSEITRALRAVSSGYVEKRDSGGAARALDGRGKRAAFSLYYGFIHFAATRAVVRDMALELGSAGPLLDIGCGTGVCGAAWALTNPRLVEVLGVDRAPFALHEAQWTFRALRVRGRTFGSIEAALGGGRRPSASVLGWALNEFSEADRARLSARLLDWKRAGMRLLVIEPVARRVAPWWDDWAAPFVASGARAAEMRLRLQLPPQIALLGRSAGLSTDEPAVRVLAS